MEQPNCLIDTNAVIDYLGSKLPDNGMTFMNTIIDAVPNVSIITKIEVLGFNTATNKYRVLTENASNFKSIKDLTVIDPYSL